jgi:4-alpha-glucanotransferase
MDRGAGIHLHVTSLPGGHGIGDLGPAAYRWIKLLSKARVGWWQMLPLVATGDGNSPYNGASAFAGNPLLISLDLLVETGWLSSRDVAAHRWPTDRVDFGRVSSFKNELLTLAWEQFSREASDGDRTEFQAFREAERYWLDDFALFAALKESHQYANWNHWPKPLARRDPKALGEAREELAPAIERHSFVQFVFARQLSALRAAAKKLGVRFIGDIPIFVSHDSADVWAHPHLFQLDRSLNSKVVAGVPPDYFCEDGQRWGNPHYDWKAMQAGGFEWWINRAKATLRQVDVVRLDHFRGFEAYWAIPARSPTARKGKWVKGPGLELFRKLHEALGSLPFIAEDLGVITPEVERLRDEFWLPGMRVLQFAFGGNANNPFLPHHYPRNAVAYTGTHDNDTTRGWYRQLSKAERRAVHRYAPGTRDDVAGELIRLAWGSVADLAIAPLQDVLDLGSKARMNTPGVATGNWLWRATERQTGQGVLDRVAELSRIYSRATS